MADKKALLVLLRSESIKTRFAEALGKNANGFIAALLNICKSNSQLMECTPDSIIRAAGLAATLKLSITPSLGQAYIVPYKDKDGILKAQFQIGVHGFVQLAQRSGQYLALNAEKIFDGQIRSMNPITGEISFGEPKSKKVVGYAAYMKLINGFEKTIYMPKAQVEEHAVTYSKSYAYDKRNGKKTSPWSTNFDAMATKTVLKKLLRNWGILSDEMKTAIQSDQAVINQNAYTYVDNGGNSQPRDDIYTTPDEPPAIEEQTIDIADQPDAEIIADAEVADVPAAARKDPF